jgi:hypothetical protein
MIVTIVANGKQHTYKNINNYDDIQNEDGTHSILINKEEVLNLDTAPDMVSVSGFAAVEPEGKPLNTNKETTEYSPTPINGEANVSESYMTLPYRLYKVLDDRTAYQLVSTANRNAPLGTPGFVYLYAICKELRSQDELNEIEIEKYSPINDYNISKIREKFSPSDIYLITEEDEKILTLPKYIYMYADDSVACDLIYGAGNKMKTNSDDSYASQLKRLCHKYLSTQQLNNVGLEPKQKRNLNIN